MISDLINLLVMDINVRLRYCKKGITVYEIVFNNILDAEKSRAAELPFEDGETGAEDEYA
jgi:hypothetical protein